MNDFTIHDRVILGFSGNGGNVTVPDGFRAIGYEAFARCEGLTGITLPKSVTDIGERAFIECKNLTYVDLPNGLEFLRNSAFNECNSLVSINIPGSVKEIGSCAFRGCKNLSKVSLADGIEVIGLLAFLRCSALEEIFIPKSVRCVGSFAFQQCNKLSRISVDEENEHYTVIDGSLYTKDKTKLVRYASALNQSEVVISPNVKAIGDGAFAGCEIKKVTLPEGLVTIGADAFSYCDSLESVNIPSSVKEIMFCAFDDCPKLTVTINNNSYAESYAKEECVSYVLG